MVGSVLQETDVRKKDLASKLIFKAPNSIDVELKSRLDMLKDLNYNSNNNSLPGPPDPPPPPLLSPLPPNQNNIFPPDVPDLEINQNTQNSERIVADLRPNLDMRKQ